MTRKLALALLLISFTGASAAQAATIGFNATYGPVAVPLAATTLAPLSQFDPALGTLTKVTLTLDADAFAGSIDWDNEAGVPTDVTLGIGAEVTALTSFGTSVVSIPLQIGSATGIAADNDGAPDFIGTDSFSVTGGVGNDVQSTVLTLALDMAPYIGTGTFTVDVAGVVQNFLSTTGGFGPTNPNAGQTDGTVTVTYEYTPIPEPGTLLLVGLGLGAVAAIRRRGVR